MLQELIYPDYRMVRPGSLTDEHARIWDVSTQTPNLAAPMLRVLRQHTATVMISARLNLTIQMVHAACPFQCIGSVLATSRLHQVIQVLHTKCCIQNATGPAAPAAGI